MLTKHDITYNTEKEDIRYPEYGRSIQEMLQYARTIQDRYKRQKTVETIVAMMQIVTPAPANRNMDDYREKLWNHAFAIGYYELDVTPPPGITIRKESEKPAPSPVDYPNSATRFRHYGASIQKLIQKAIEMPDGPKKEGFVEVIASYMKLAYKTWNKEHYVSDDIVKDDLEILSNGKLVLHEGHNSLDVLAAHAGKGEKDRPSSGMGSKGGRRNRKGGSGGNGGNSNNRNSGGSSSNRNRSRSGGGGGVNYGNSSGGYRKRKK